MRVTIREVAREAGVSISTASRALNHKGDITSETRTSIVEAARKLGYTPSSVARALVLGRTRTLGVVVTDNTSPVYAQALRGVQEVATREGFGLLFCNSADSQDQALQCLTMLTSKQVDGVMLAPVQTDRRDIDLLERDGVPFIFLLRHFPEIAHVDHVITDNVEGGRLVTEHLLDQGHVRVGHIGGPAHTSTGQGRLTGYRQALEARGIPYAADLVIHASYSVAGGSEAARRLLDRVDRPSAIFAATDVQAVGVFRAARDLALRVPEDVALAGGDDIELSEYLEVPLTTFHQPAREIGALAAEILISKIAGEIQPVRQVVIRPALVVRWSSGCRR